MQEKKNVLVHDDSGMCIRSIFTTLSLDLLHLLIKQYGPRCPWWRLFLPKVCASRLWYLNMRFIKYGSMNSASHRGHICTYDMIWKVKAPGRYIKHAVDGRNAYEMTASLFRPLWHTHTARERKKDRDRYRQLDQHNRKQWVLAPFPVSDQCEHFCTIH